MQLNRKRKINNLIFHGTGSLRELHKVLFIQYLILRVGLLFELNYHRIFFYIFCENQQENIYPLFFDSGHEISNISMVDHDYPEGRVSLT